jgi:hypothetical protein
MAQMKVFWYIILLVAVVIILSAGVIFILRWINPLLNLPKGGSGSDGEANQVVKIPTTVNKELLVSKEIIGIGILGDSDSDEYRADDHRGGDYADTTLNWVELLALNRNLNFGPWGTWGEPRRTGYKYNWARSGATAKSLIDSGQHTGLAQQIASGEVSDVVVYIGDNDFHLKNGTYREIYDGSLSGARLQEKLDGVVKNITLAVDTVMQAGEVRVIVVSITDKGMAPDILLSYPNSAGRQRASAAIQEVNAGIEAMAAERGVVVVDLNAFALTLLPQFNKLGTLTIDGERFKGIGSGNEPHFLRLGDSSGHAGTVLSGLFANAILIEPLDKAFGMDIPPLSNNEIFHSAGIR